MKRIVKAIIVFAILMLSSCNNNDNDNRSNVVTTSGGSNQGQPITEFFSTSQAKNSEASDQDIKEATENFIENQEKYENFHGQAMIDENTMSFKKVLIARTDANICRVVGSTKCKNPLKPFESLYIFDEREKDGKWLQVGKTRWKDDIQGWLPADGTVYWNTNIGWRLLRKKDKEGPNPQIIFFETEKKLLDYLNGEKVEPAFKTAYDYPPTFMAWIELQSKEVNTKQGKRVIAQMAIIGKPEGKMLASNEDGANIVQSSREEQIVDLNLSTEIAKIKARTGKTNILFVIDSTISMEPYIQSTLNTVRNLVREIKSKNEEIGQVISDDIHQKTEKALATSDDRYRDEIEQIKRTHSKDSFKSNLRFGLTTYRDFLPISVWLEDENGKKGPVLTKPLKSPQAFLEDLSGLRTASETTYGIKEAVKEALMSAINNTHINDDLSDSIIILIGNSSGWNKEEVVSTADGSMRYTYKLSNAEVVQAAKEKGISIFTMPITNISSQDAAEQERQFNELALGTGGEMWKQGSANELSKSVARIIKERAIILAQARMKATGTLISEVLSDMNLPENNDQRVRETIASITSNIKDQKSQERITEVLIQIKDEIPGLIKLKRSGEKIGKMWACVNPGNTFVAQREMFIDRIQLDMLIDNLGDVREALFRDDDSKMTLLNFREMLAQKYRNSPTPHFMADPESSEMMLSTWLKIKGIWISDDSILKKSAQDIWNLNEVERDEIWDQMSPIITSLNNSYGDNDRFPEKYLPGWVPIPEGL